MDNYSLKLVQLKYKAWKRYSFSRNHTDYLDYCQIRNKVTRSVRFANKRFEREISLEAKENPKSFWKFVKSDLINKNGDWISDDYEKANELNDFLDQFLPRTRMTIYMYQNFSQILVVLCVI